MKKTLSLLLSVILLLSAVVLPVSAESADAFTVSVDTVNAAQAQNDVVVPIRLSGNPGVSGFSFCVEYDSQKLVLIKSEVAINFGYKVAKETSDDGINLAWTGADNYTNDGIVANLHFNVAVNASVGKADIKIKFRDGYDSFYQTIGGKEQDISVITQAGGVNISNAEPTSSLSVTVGTASAAINETDIAIPISVENNTGISGFSFCVDYDSTRLNLESSEIALNDGYKVVGTPEGHAVNLAWTSDSGFANNGIIAYLRFSVKENAVPGKGYISIAFRDGYDSFYKVVGGKESDVACTTINGYIDISNHTYGEWVIITEATCKNTGLKRRTCTDSGCGKTDEVIIPKAPHKYVDTVVPATCKEQGYTQHTCSVCSESFSDTYTEKLKHSLGDWEQSIAPDCTNNGQEVRKCALCGDAVEQRELTALGHDWGEWTIFKAATFREDGESRKYCSRCEAYKSQRIPKLSESHTHDFTGKEEIVTPASCTAEGSKKVYCSETECGEFITKPIPKTDHDFGEWKITTEPTFDTDGEKARRCKNCDEIETARIPKLSEGHIHDFTGREEIIKPATCTEKGEKRVYCLNSSCGEYTVVAIDMIDHIKGDWEITEQPSCNKTGTKVKRCTSCGKVLESESIDMTKHTLSDVVTPPTPTSQGYTTHTCTVCGYSYIDSYTDYEAPHVHDFSGKEELIEAATCTKDGCKKIYCTGDGCNEYTIVTLPKIAHTAGEWEIIEPATCSKCGTKAKKCIGCGKVMETADVEMLKHSYVDTVIPPTPTAQGYTTHKCSACGYQYIDSYTDYVEENPVQITIDTKKVRAGKTVLVNVSLQNNPGMWGMDLAVNYDKTKLTLISVTNGMVFADAEWTKGNLSGEIYILSYEAGGLENIMANGVIAALEFTVNEDAQADDFYEISVSFNNGDIINADFEEINPTVVSGGIKVIDVIYGDLNGDGVVNKKDSLLMKMYLADNSTDIDKEAADVFHDGVINKKDSLYLKQFLAGLDVELGA